MSEWVPGRRSTVVVVEQNHLVGNDHCAVCDHPFPRRCEHWPRCRGIVHMERVTKDTIRTVCDICKGAGFRV